MRRVVPGARFGIGIRELRRGCCPHNDHRAMDGAAADSEWGQGCFDPVQPSPPRKAHSLLLLGTGSTGTG